MHGSATRIATAPQVVPKAKPYPIAAAAISPVADRYESGESNVLVVNQSPLFCALDASYEYHAVLAQRVAATERF